MAATNRTTGGGAQAAAIARAGALKRTKTATTPVTLPKAYIRALSIRRTGAFGALREAAISPAADSPCLGGGGAAKILVRPCVRRLSMIGGPGRARCLRQLAVACCAETLTVIATEGGRALGPMLLPSAWEHWQFFVLRDSCHAAVLDQPGLP